MATLGDLSPDKRNARRHNSRNVSLIESSIQRDGFGRSLLLANDGTILAGNATYDAASSAGLEDVVIVPSDGTRVIAVQRTDIEPGSPEAIRLSLADNRATDLSDWDASILSDLAADVDLSAFWYEDELTALLAGLDDSAAPVGDEIASVTFGDTYGLVVSCTSQVDQETLFNEMTGRGYTCRPLTS